MFDYGLMVYTRLMVETGLLVGGLYSADGYERAGV
jgi:hypothetical protein